MTGFRNASVRGRLAAMRGSWAAALLVVGLFPFGQVGCPEGDSNSLYDGYSWNGICVPGYVSVETWFTPAPIHSIGAAVFYAPNVMEAQAPYRGMSLDGFLDGVSLMSPADIGNTVWLRRPGFGWEGPFLVLDCASREDFYPIIVGREEAVEVGFTTAVRWGMAQRTDGGWRATDWRIDDVEVWKGDRPPKENYTNDPIRMSAWLQRHLVFSSGPVPGERLPVYRRHPTRWLWRDRVTELIPSDDWMSFLWPDPIDYCRGYRLALDECRAAFIGD